MSKASLQSMMNKRTPLVPREVVTPAHLYTNPQVDNTTSLLVDKPTKPVVEKYTTHLRPETIKAIKRTALEEDRKDYEIVQLALDAFLDRGASQPQKANTD